MVCLVVMFAISLQCSVLSSFLSALHEIEHASEIVDAHSALHGDHHHASEGDHHHPDTHHSSPDVLAGVWLVLDGHSYGLDPDHLSGEHGFFHFSGGTALFDHSEDGFGLGVSSLLADPPQATCATGLSCVSSAPPHRPPIA